MMIKQDPDRLGPQWHCDAIPGYWFSSAQDVGEAVRLAQVVAALAEQDATTSIRYVIEEVSDWRAEHGQQNPNDDSELLHELARLLPPIGHAYQFPASDWRPVEPGSRSRAERMADLISRAQAE